MSQPRERARDLKASQNRLSHQMMLRRAPHESCSTQHAQPRGHGLPRSIVRGAHGIPEKRSCGARLAARFP